MEKMLINGSLENHVQMMGNLLPVAKSFDLIQRNLIIGGRESSYYFVDGFTKDEAMIKIMSLCISYCNTGWVFKTGNLQSL